MAPYNLKKMLNVWEVGMNKVGGAGGKFNKASPVRALATNIARSLVFSSEMVHSFFGATMNPWWSFTSATRSLKGRATIVNGKTVTSYFANKTLKRK
jgi:hypothetical protein